MATEAEQETHPERSTMSPMNGSEGESSVAEIANEALLVGAETEEYVELPGNPMDDSERAIEQTQQTIREAQAALRSSRTPTRQASKDDTDDNPVAEAAQNTTLPLSSGRGEAAAQAGVSIVSRSDAEEGNGMENDNIKDNIHVGESANETAGQQGMPPLDQQQTAEAAVIEPDTPSNGKGDNKVRKGTIAGQDLQEEPGAQVLEAGAVPSITQLPRHMIKQVSKRVLDRNGSHRSLLLQLNCDSDADAEQDEKPIDTQDQVTIAQESAAGGQAEFRRKKRFVSVYSLSAETARAAAAVKSINTLADNDGMDTPDDASIDLDKALTETSSASAAISTTTCSPQEIIPKHSARQTAIKSIVEEGSESKDASLHDSGHSIIAPLRESLRQESKAGLGSNPLAAVTDGEESSFDDPPISLSISSVPDTEQDKQRTSQRMKNRVSTLAKSPSAKSVASHSPSPAIQSGTPPIKRSSSFKVKGMWKGLKKRMNVVTAIKRGRSGKSPPRTTTSFEVNTFPTMAQAPIRRAETSPHRGQRQRQGRFPKATGMTSSSRTLGGREGNRTVHRTRSRSEEPIRKVGRVRTGASTSSDITDAELAEFEKIGKALKDSLQTMEYLDRRKQKTYKKCFYGSAAVDFLCQYTQTARLDATKIGRELAHHLGLFMPITVKMHSTDGTRRAQIDSLLLQDSSSTVYRFAAFLPCEVKGLNSEAKARHFEEGVSVKTRRQGLRKHKNCFVGAGAVTFLVKSKIVKSRAEALDLGKLFINEFNLFEPVNRDHDFLDSQTELYRFVDKKNRYFSINNMLSTRLIQMGRMDSDADVSEEDDGDASVAQDYQQLVEVAEILERGIKVSDNTKKATTKKASYLNSFVAARAVTFMVTSGLADTREDATDLGRRLEREFNLFTEATGQHDFSDSNRYFRFTAKGDRFTKLHVEKSLPDISLSFEQGVKVKDYTYRLKTYKDTFTGSKAVDFLVNSRLAQSRSQAVRIGCQLVYHFNLFEKVTGDKEFCDDHQFFRFTSSSERHTLEIKSPKEERRTALGLLMNHSPESRATLVPKDVPEELLKLADSFLEGVKVKEHKFRAKAYRQTFLGSEAVSFMVNSSLSKSRKEAVDLGRKLSKDLGLFAGIDGAKDFKDDYLLYWFSERFEEQHGEESSNRSKGLVSGIAGLQGVSVKSLPLEKIAEAFRNGVKVSLHKERLKIYKHSFVGSDAVDFLVGSGLSESRVDAVDLGRSVAQEFNLFEHVQKDREFEDEDFLYQFSYEGEIRPLEVIEMEISRLMNIAKDFELCVKVKAHKFRLTKYKDTFLGTDAVDYLVNSCVATSRKEAVQIGRALNKEFNLFEHVTNDRKLEDANNPYFFVKNNERYKGLNLEKKRARRNIFACSDDDSSTMGDDDMLGSSTNHSMTDTSVKYKFETEDTEWANKMATFERRMHGGASTAFASTGHFMSARDDDSSADSSVVRKHALQERFAQWSSKFRKLDPRYQIEYFFDFVAQDGAEDAETSLMEVDNLRPLFNFLPNRAQVFTVWRPTSLDAIRKMMLGEAVGKGLDIKGKSAKRGKLSGFVPFLQIGENKHKSKIRPPSKEGKVRVFYPGDARRGRDITAEKLERVALEMIETVEGAKKALDNNGTSKSARKDALGAMLLDMGPDPSITYIDECAPERYGLEIPERLFWEAFFVRQDCTRKPGSEYDTGRPSQPAFQDMNFAAIRAEPKEDAPRAVVYQSADSDSPMNPFELLVAYEENGRVMPVVSDFDCFLVGTKRVNFTSPLADDQMKVLTWYVNEIENVMKTSKVGDSWTVNWLEVLKKAAREGFYPEMPRFGFGDPKSYSIMKNAVTRLSHSGAVRHGAECFNYYFPQDLDDEFLVVANDLPDNQPWAYVDEAGLQDILMKKIDQGYTFPLNPKWVLCDSYRWKELYDKLLLSDKKETQQSMNIWFPPESGLREQIERVHERRPNGFYTDGPGTEVDSDDSSSEEGDAGGAKDMMSTVVALRLLERFQARTKKYQSGDESNDEVSESEE